jgi:agmatine/peptidylarginine deiminase
MNLKWLAFFGIFLCTVPALAQEPLKGEPEKLTHWLTPSEKLRLNEIGRGFQETPPPTGPIRNVAEFDRVQGALIRYPFGLPYSAIKEMANDLTVTTIVASAALRDTVIKKYVTNGIDTSHCDFLIAPTNTYWTRDYGPWFESDSSNQIGIVDFPYNRPRPSDDEIPKKVADKLGLPWFGMNLVATGGNYMTDGMGISASTTLIETENPTLTYDQISQKVQDYLGVNNYYLRTDLNPPEYIEHIDCWGKFLAPDKILLKKVNPSHPNYNLIESEAAFWASQISSYGYPFRVFRVRTPSDQPYTNSVILNNKVLVPFMNSAWDDSATAVYENAMPGYEIFGFTALSGEPWVSTDALHCRVMGIADVGLLYIRHVPLSGNLPCENDYAITADVIACSKQPLKTDSVLIYYSVNNGSWLTSPMVNTASNQFSGSIPKQPAGSEIRYYLFAADESERQAMAPFIGPGDPFRFSTIHTNLCGIPDTLWFLTQADAQEGKITQITNLTEGAITLESVQQQGDHLPWFVDSMSVTSLPHQVSPGDSVAVRVRMILPLNPVELTQFEVDTMDILSGAGPLQVIIMINKDLLTLLADKLPDELLGGNYPNPFTEVTTIPVTLPVTGKLELDIFDLRGIKIRNLASGIFQAGNHTFSWDGRGSDGKKVQPGIYFYSLTSEKKIQTKRMVVIQ